MLLSPEARFFAGHYLQATEWNLATLEELVTLKGVAKSRIARQRKICLDMLLVCNEICAKDPSRSQFQEHGRVAKIFKDAIAPGYEAATNRGLNNAITNLLEGKLDG